MCLLTHQRGCLARCLEYFIRLWSMVRDIFSWKWYNDYSSSEILDAVELPWKLIGCSMWFLLLKPCTFTVWHQGNHQFLLPQRPERKYKILTYSSKLLLSFNYKFILFATKQLIFSLGQRHRPEHPGMRVQQWDPLSFPSLPARIWCHLDQSLQECGGWCRAQQRDNLENPLQKEWQRCEDLLWELSDFVHRKVRKQLIQNT